MAKHLFENGNQFAKHHGHTAKGKESPTYVSWQSMKMRCLYPSVHGYEKYGGKGVRFPRRWERFENFLADMGERPPGTSLDRFPKRNGNYKKGNCRWATRTQQQRNRDDNRMLEFRGKIQPMVAWAKELKIGVSTIATRLDRCGWSVEKTLGEPAKPLLPMFTFDGRTMSMKAWAKFLGVTYAMLYQRMRRGLPVERILKV